MQKKIAFFAILIYNNAVEKRLLKNFICDGMRMDFVAMNDIKNDSFKKHCHDWYELLFFVDANGEYVVEDMTYEVRGGDTVLIAPGRYHFLKNYRQKNYRRIVFSFDARFFGDSTFLSDTVKKTEFFEKDHYSDFSAVMSRFSEKCLSLPDAYMPQLVRSALTWAFLNTVGVPPAPPSAYQSDRISAKAVRYISENLSGIRNTDQIADALFVSRSALQHAFKKDMDIPLMQYMRIKRLFLVRQLVSRGKSIAESALEAGYEDYTTFFRSFKSHFGYPPAELKLSRKK